MKLGGVAVISSDMLWEATVGVGVKADGLEDEIAQEQDLAEKIQKFQYQMAILKKIRHQSEGTGLSQNLGPPGVWKWVHCPGEGNPTWPWGCYLNGAFFLVQPVRHTQQSWITFPQPCHVHTHPSGKATSAVQPSSSSEVTAVP